MATRKLGPVEDHTAREAARWWLEERGGWPLDRALGVFLTLECGYFWNPEHQGDREQYEKWYAAVLDAARELEDVR